MKLRTVGPYLLLVPPALALVLFADQFPSPMPVHWDVAGRPNGFFPRTPLALAFPLLLMGGILLLLDGIVASGARAGPPSMAEAVRRLLAPIRWVLGLMATPAAFAPLWGPTPVLVLAGVMVVVVVAQIVRAPRSGADPTEGWRGGLFYVNAADPRLLVPKRSGMGWTFNFARPVAWLLLAVLLLLPIAMVATACGAHPLTRGPQPPNRDLDRAEHAEVDAHHVVHLELQRGHAGAGGHHLTRPQRHADAGQLVDQPRERSARVPQDVGAAAFASVPAQHLGTHPVRHQIQATPGYLRSSAEDEVVRAGIVGDQLGGARAHEVRVPRIGDLDRRMQAGDQRPGPRRWCKEQRAARDPGRR